MNYAKIIGTGMYVPPKVLTNQDMCQFYDTSDEWIYERSGIKERHFVEGKVGTSELAVPAVKKALAQANLSFQDIDFIIFATLSPEAFFPGSGVFLAAQLDPESTVPALDIRMQCSGFIYGLSLAALYIKQGVYQNILVVGAEIQSTSIDFSPQGRGVGVLFGDGAGAVVVQSSTIPGGVLSSDLHTQGKYAKELWLEEPNASIHGKMSEDIQKRFTQMNGREVFKHAITRMTESIKKTCATEGWALEEIDIFFIHQANARIVEAIAKTMNLPLSKFFINIHKYGNTTAATIPICIAEATEEGLIQSGKKSILAAFGSGFTWGSIAVQW